jgi:chromosome segregation ATPase
MGEEAASHIETKKAVFNYFVELALKNLIALRGEQQKAKQQRKILASKLRTLESTNWGIGSLFGRETNKSLDTVQMEQEIDRLEAELKTLETTPVTLDNVLETIVESLSSARDQLWKTSVTIKLNRMGIKLEEDSKDTAITLHLNEYCSSEGRKVIALPIYIPFDQIPAKPDFLTEASRYL